MRVAFLLSFVANVALAMVSLSILPDRVAVHFGPGGAPDAWASNRATTGLMLGLYTCLFCIFYFSPRLITALPLRWINLPNRDFWLQPQHLSAAMRRFGDCMWQYGTALFCFLFFVGLLTLRANLSDPVRLEERMLLTALLIYLGYTAYWVFALLRAFRVPKPD